MASPPPPLTPASVEAKLRQLVTDLTRAQQSLSERRDTCTEAEILLKRARIAASHSANCPRPVRGGTTVAERESWIDTEVQAEWEAYRRAATAQEIAQDALRTTRDIASTVQTLARSVQQAYQLAGSS